VLYPQRRKIIFSFTHKTKFLLLPPGPLSTFLRKKIRAPSPPLSTLPNPQKPFRKGVRASQNREACSQPSVAHLPKSPFKKGALPPNKAPFLERKRLYPERKSGGLERGTVGSPSGGCREGGKAPLRGLIF